MDRKGLRHKINHTANKVLPAAAKFSGKIHTDRPTCSPSAGLCLNCEEGSDSPGRFFPEN